MIHAPRSRHAGHLLALLAAMACTAGIAQTTTPTTMHAAMDAYERGHWDEAYRVVGALADAGDGEAARIALLMQRHGPQLYGRDFGATPTQRATWRAALLRDGLRTAAKAGSS
ncbi:MAG: hypothetical protein ACLGIT_06120 [Gammaproteobacteria bacterium]|uniref:hypothetical protein n=1 Tax=Azohydromonas sp. TaxID=1872666 RepID=UPI002CFD2961|nr:hypothetical protein [Azohydromonas sp.]HMM85256.1 hypothetical protein [Azohydromonas sp.]